MRLVPKHFLKTVTTAGTRQQLTTASIRVPSVDFQAKPGNGNRVFIGDSSVSSTNYMASLGPTDSLHLDAAVYGMAGAQWDLSDFWLDVGTSGEGLSVGYGERKSAE